MQTRSLIFPFLIVSLLLHAAILLAMKHIPLSIRLSTKTLSPAVVHPVVLLPPEPPAEPPFGEKQNTGLALNAMEAPVPQQTSRYAPVEQAMLSTDPVGQQSDISEESPSSVVEIPPPEPSEPSFQPPVEPPKLPAVSPVVPEEPVALASAQPSPHASSSTPARPSPSDTKPVSQPFSPPQIQTNTSGDPAPLSDRDSDAFGPSVSLEIVAGRVQPRSGRQLKFKRPRLNLAGFVDTAVISLPARALLEIEIDDTGTPRRVWIKRSTGSSSIDRAIELAAYESWFEPVRALEHASRKERFEMNITLH